MPSIKKKSKSKSKTKKRGGAASNDIIHGMPIIDLYTSIHNYLAFERAMQQGPALKIGNKIRERLRYIFQPDTRDENSRLYIFLLRCMTIDNNIFTKEPMLVFKHSMVQILQDKMKTHIKTILDNSIHRNLRVSDIEPIFQELVDETYINSLEGAIKRFTIDYFKDKADEIEIPIIDRPTYISIMNIIKVIVIGYVNKDIFDLYSYQLLGVIPKDITKIADPSHIQKVMEIFMTNVVHGIHQQLNHPENLVARIALNPFVFLRDIGRFLWNHVNKAANSLQKQITENAKTNNVLFDIQRFFLYVENIEPYSHIGIGEPPIFSKSEIKNVVRRIKTISELRDSNSVSNTSLHNILENLKNMIAIFQDDRIKETISTRRTMILNMYKKRSVSIDQSVLRKGLNKSSLLGRSASTHGRYTRNFKTRIVPGKKKYIKKKRTPLSNGATSSSYIPTSSNGATSSSDLPTSPIISPIIRMNDHNRNDSNTNHYNNTNSNVENNQSI